MLRYIKTNAGAVRMRAPDAPVIVLLDWDSEKKKNEFLQPFHSEDPFHVLVWPQTAFNPKLGATFRGIERHMPDRFIAGADVGIGIVATKPDGTFIVERREYPALKEKIFSMVEKDLKAEDLIFVAPFIKQIMAIANPEA